MKLQQLAKPQKAKQTAKIFESYFGQKINVDLLDRKSAQNLLSRVRTLIREQRQSAGFHKSEKNSSYLKLVMLEQMLGQYISEQVTSAGSTGTTPSGTSNSTAGTANPAAQTVAAQAVATKKFKDPKMQSAVLKVQKGQALNTDEQKLLAAAAMMPQESRRRRGYMLGESEIQQAQVVLAAQDMVDQVQSILEDVTSMQFKDLPALVDQIRNEVGTNQSQQFNNDASQALSALVQNLQQTKQQLEVALGVVTGQPMEMPADLGAAAPTAEMPGAAQPEVEVPELPAEPEEPVRGAPAASLGRGRR